MPLFKLDNNIAVVTGASRGLGQAIALALGRSGATVIGTATTESGAQRISEALAAENIRGEGRVLDVTDREAPAPLIKAVADDYGPVSILVNNAGITRDNLMMRMKDEEWDDIVETNLSAVYRMSKAVLRTMMKARGGRIINIASVVGCMGNAGQSNYAAAKAGVMGLTRSLAREVGSRGITVNAVAPGFIATDMTDEMGEDQRQSLLSQVPLERLGEPDEVAAAVVYLASPAAGYITGETLNINGGLYMN